MKNNEKLIDEIFEEGQRKLIKRAIVNTTQLNDKLSVSILQIGKETSVLLYGTDLNDNTHYAMMSSETFDKLKKIKFKGV